MAVQLLPEFWNGKTVFLTGHTGFKGSWMTLLLNELGAKTHGFALAPNTNPSLFEVSDCQACCISSTIADIHDGSALKQAMQAADPDVVIHMAAQPIVSEGYNDPVRTFSTNVMGTVHFLEALRGVCAIDAGVQAHRSRLGFVVSSDKCYRNLGEARDFLEDDPLGGLDPYSASKAATELVVTSWRASWLGAGSGCKLASGRAGNVIGGGDWSLNRLLPDAARALSEGQTVDIRNPYSTRPWQHVLEPIVAYLCVIQEMSGRDDMETGWNIGPVPSVSWPVKDVIDTFVRYWPSDTATWTTSDMKQDFKEAAKLALNSAKLSEQTGWSPVLTMQDAVQWSADWYATYYLGGRDAAREKTLKQIRDYLDLFQNRLVAVE